MTRTTRLTKGRALVAGGGIGGMAAAVGLARGGFAVTVLERAPQLLDVGSGLVLYPNGLAALDALGEELGRAVRESGHAARPGEQRAVYDSAGRLLAQEPIGVSADGRTQVSLLRSALHRALHQEALAAGARIRFGATVRDWSESEAGVVAHLADGERCAADLLVAADGIRSVLRAGLLGDGPPRYRGYSSVRGRTTGSPLHPDHFVVNGRGLQLFAAPVGPDTLYWTAKITAEAGHWPALGGAEAQQALLDAMDGWYEPFVRLVRDAEPGELAVTDIRDREPVSRWATDRVALLGDAAHPMVPALGQGANLALEDACVLAAALRANPDVPTALRAYQEQRHRRAAAVVLRSRRQGALDQGRSRLGAAVRDALTRRLGRKDTSLHHVVSWRPAPSADDARTAPRLARTP